MSTNYVVGQYNKGAAAGWERILQADDDGNLIITPLSGSTFDCNITQIAGHAVTHGAGAVADGTIRITLGNDDTQFGAVGAASDVDGNVHGQLRFAGEELDDIHDECIDMLSALQLIDDTVYADGVGTPSKGILVMGHDGTNPQALSVNSDGELKVNLETADIEIGAVEIKNATDDTRATVNANGLCVDIAGQTLTALKVSKDANANAANNAIFTQISQDGTNAVATAYPLPVSATVAANAATNPIYVRQSVDGTNPIDGTHPLPISSDLTANSVAHPIGVQLSADGTNAMDATHPLVISATATANAVTNPMFTQLSQDGTNAVAAAYPLPISATMAANAVGNPIYTIPVVNGNAVVAATPMPISATEAANGVANPIGVQLSQDGTNAVAAAYPLPISATMAANAAGNPIYVSGTVAATNKPATANATGAGAIATTTAISENFRLVSVTCHFNIAPTTAGNLTITKDALAGAAYDVVFKTVDATLGTDIVYLPEGDLLFVDGDEIAVAYANADGRTYGLEITYVKV